MVNSLGQVPDYTRIRYYQEIVNKAKRDYLKHLISIGYVFERQGMYESTTYWAIHKDYYKTPEERIWSEDFDGTTTPNCFPTGAFIIVNTVAESETDDPWETKYFLYESYCSIEYLIT